MFSPSFFKQRNLFRQFYKVLTSLQPPCIEALNMEEEALFHIFRLSATILLCCFLYTTFFKTSKPSYSSWPSLSYYIFGDSFALAKNRRHLNEYITELIRASPTKTILLRRSFGACQTITANPSNVEHILKTHFYTYPKGRVLRSPLSDLLGTGIFNIDGEQWKFQRKISSHEFNTKSLRKFVETAVKFELTDRLIPLLNAAATGKTVIEFQDILQRFAFDNICKIAFGSDPGCLDLTLPTSDFAEAFDTAVGLSAGRINSVLPAVWKVKRFFGIGSEKRLRRDIEIIRRFAHNLVRERKNENNRNNGDNNGESDLLSRFLNSGELDENSVVDIVISFILAGRDTTSAALTWFFWLVSGNSRVETEILAEIDGTSKADTFEGVKEMVYLHATLCESMRLYPPVPTDSKEASNDDTLPDGTVVRRFTRVTYSPYAMGRMENIWGEDWPEFKPERWLRSPVNGDSGKRWVFVGEDPYRYPVFQAGPRVCLGKEMAFLQMKSLASTVLRRFRVSPAVKDFNPVFISTVTSKMEGGFPVRIEERIGV